MLLVAKITMIGRTQLSKVEHDEEFHEENTEQDFSDEAAIRRVVDGIDNACDAKNWKKCRSFFADEVEVDFKSLSGGEPGKIKSDELIETWKTNLFEEKKSFHQRTNHRIRIEGDRAEVFSKGYAFNLLEEGENAGFWEVWGNYRHALERTEKGWKVSGLTLEVIHRRGDERVRTYVPEN